MYISPYLQLDPDCSHMQRQTHPARYPLATYNFHPLDPSFEGPFAVWLRTLRDPGTHEEPKAQDASRPAAVDATLQDPKYRLQVLTHLVVLMLFVRDWASMSNAADGEWSLEGVHDSLHLYIGGDGHMADVGMAGFDPIFNFHHTNVDRLLAIWQALHPGKKVAPGSSRGGTSTIPPNTTVDESTDLTPFRLTDAKFWKSSETYRATDFGSYYPQLGPHATQAEAYAFVKELQAHIGRPLDTNHREWVVSAELKPRELPKSGFVHVFLSPDAPAVAEAGSWLRHETLVGSIPIFITNSTQCANCNQFDESWRKIHGQVFLTDSLLDKGHDLGDDEKVEEYLQKHIHWGLALTNGQEVPLTSVPSLVVKVQSAQIHPPQGGAVERNDGGLDLPTIDPFKIHHSVTVGKLRGYNPDQA